jgi:hypothetical protein
MATRTQRPPESTEASIDARWLAFAGVYLMLAGGANLLWGIAALANKEYFSEDGLVWSSLATWGWVALVIGAVQFATGVLTYIRKPVAMIVALLLAMCGILFNFTTVGAYPLWSTVAIVCNALVLWAVTVHWTSPD